MTHYIGVVASLAIRRSPTSTQPANLLLIPARAAHWCARPCSLRDPSHVQQLIDNQWEEGTPAWLPWKNAKH